MRTLGRFHLWCGLLASLVIFLEVLTGILLIHTNWLSFAKETYLYPTAAKPYRDSVDIGTALQRASRSGNFSLEQVRLVMNHSLGDGHHGTTGDYKARLRDTAQTLYIFDTAGNLLRKESNLTQNWVRDFHYGELEGADLTWLLDIVAIIIMFLTISGVILSLRSLRRSKKLKLKNT